MLSRKVLIFTLLFTLSLISIATGLPSLNDVLTINKTNIHQTLFSDQSEDDLLVYFHPKDSNNIDFQILSSLDSVVNSIEKFRGKYWSNIKDGFQIVNDKKTLVNLTIAQVNCQDEGMDVICNSILKESDDIQSKVILPKGLTLWNELSVGYENTLQKLKTIVNSLVLNRLKFFPSKKRLTREETTTQEEQQTIKTTMIEVKEDASMGEVISNIENSSDNTTVTTEGSTLRTFESLSPNNDINSLTDSILFFLSTKYQLNNEERSDFLKRFFPRPYIYNEQCNFEELFSGKVNVSPYTFVLLHKGPDYFDFSKKIINEFLLVKRALRREISVGMIKMCTGEAIDAFKVSERLFGKDNFGNVLMYNFLYGKNEKEVTDRGLLLFYNPGLRGNSELNLYQGEPYDAQLVYAKGSYILNQINLMTKQSHELNGFVDYRDSNFVLYRGLYDLNDIYEEAIRDWAEKKGKPETFSFADLKGYNEKAKKLLERSKEKRTERLSSRFVPIQLPEDDLTHTDLNVLLTEETVELLNYLEETLSSKGETVLKSELWQLIKDKTQIVQNEIVNARDSKGEDCIICEKLYRSLFALDSMTRMKHAEELKNI
ncbi:hypothetical protein ABK040_005911 [Willaertia magna]